MTVELAIIDQATGVCKISGDLNVEHATDVFSSINFSNVEKDHIIVDLSGVQESDSAALAVMLEWANQANKSQKKISFTHVSDQLMRLIKMAELQKILNIA